MKSLNQLPEIAVRRRYEIPKVILATLALLGLLALVGLGCYVGFWQLWAGYHHRQAHQAIARRDFEAAHAHLCLCLEIWLHSAETEFETARVARRAGRYAEAEKHLKICKELRWAPESVELEQVLLQAQRGHTQKYEDVMVDWINREHPDSVLILEAFSWGYIKNYELVHALQCLEIWLKKEPDNVQALIWRGDARERMRRMEDAAEDYSRAVELDPDNEQARRLLANYLIYSHQGTSAIEHFQWLRQRFPSDPGVLLGLARSMQEIGRPEEAGQLVDQLLEEDPRDAMALSEKGRLAMEEGKFTEAENWLRKAVALAPYEKETLFSFWQCLEKQQKFDEAKKWKARFDQVDIDLIRMTEVMMQIRQTPRDPNLRLQAGKLLIENAQDVEGLRWLDSALQQDPNHQPTRQYLAAYFEKRGDQRRAAYFRQTANVEGAGVSLQGNVSPLLQKSGRIDSPRMP
ncbi:MAG: tetratricopeptide repeat protein [Gemmataceae bacterium]